MGMMTRHCRPYPHDDCMDRHALERLGHHVVSRRVALGYRNRTDPADSLQFTVRTLADIEHGVRRASRGTYAMQENKLSWAPGSIDTILANGEPQELVVKQRSIAHHYNRSSGYVFRRAAQHAKTTSRQPPLSARSAAIDCVARGLPGRLPARPGGPPPDHPPVV